MTIGLFSLADPSIAQSDTKDGSKKSPPKRTVTALADQQAVPEPR